ncbi:MAG: hypothetical protein IJ576_04900 [Synergistaceae bacterium]|nr:hypothetical protein [Synergistaceae bacterium]MBR1418283.1 hypothetical protein [Synergistaceae bacterium]
MQDANNLNNLSAEELLDKAYNSEDDAEIAALVNQALELEPDNPEALLLLSDITQEPEERLSILLSTLDNLHDALHDLNVPHDLYAEHELGVVYLALMQRAAFTLFEVGDDEQAMEFIEQLLNYDIDDGGAVKSLYYRILIERGDWQRILDETLNDDNHELGWAYARVTAAFMLKDLNKANKYFWEALMMSPNVPFYMLGYFAEPIDESLTQELNDFNFAILYADVWALSRDLLNWFSRSVILFGLLSGRFAEQTQEMREILKSLKGEADYKKLSNIIKLRRINPKNDVELIETIYTELKN